MKKKFLIGNWKMNCSKEECIHLIDSIQKWWGENYSMHNTISIGVIPSFVHIPLVKSRTTTSSIRIGAQNCSSEIEGAYTGEVSAKMLNSYDIDCVLVGHSERRNYYKEDSGMLVKKTQRILENSINPIFCCGESLEHRRENNQRKVILEQLQEGLLFLDEQSIQKVIIAYEPVWAIGTGKSATKEQIEEMHYYIREQLIKKYNATIGSSIPIIYGGSCKPSNADSIFSCDHVDGALVGNASLSSKTFIELGIIMQNYAIR